MAMLRRAVGEKTAFDLVATGRLLSAEEARQVGLVSRIVAADGFDDAVHAILQEIAGFSPSALAFIKQQLYQLDGLSFEDGIGLGARVNAAARATADFKRAVQRFLKKKEG
jgi:enoyl-CoA hydratase/carnithine racemase